MLLCFATDAYLTNPTGLERETQICCTSKDCTQHWIQMPDKAGYIRASPTARLGFRERAKKFQMLFSFSRTEQTEFLFCFPLTGSPPFTTGCLTSIWSYDGLKKSYLWLVLNVMTAAHPSPPVVMQLHFEGFCPFYGEKCSLVKQDCDSKVCVNCVKTVVTRLTTIVKSSPAHGDLAYDHNDLQPKSWVQLQS